MNADFREPKIGDISFGFSSFFYGKPRLLGKFCHIVFPAGACRRNPYFNLLASLSFDHIAFAQVKHVVL